MNSSDNLSLAALVVALLAFLIAIGQLLQQIFGTADGFRRCQSSVIGEWATKTRLSWRWKEFRFETKFTTPIIKLLPIQEQYRFRTTAKDGLGREHVCLTGSPDSRKAALTPILRPEEEPDIAGWVLLLEQLQTLQWYTNPLGTTMRSTNGYIEAGTGPQRQTPAVLFRERSWDLMPAELTKPLAATTVGDLVVMAHRLGMRWMDIRPSRGVMRADGNGHSLSSIQVRGYGLVVQYSNDHSSEERDRWSSLLIPTREADKLACGIIPGCKVLVVPDLLLTSPDVPFHLSIRSALTELRVSEDAKKWLTTEEAQSQKFPALMDIPGMLAAFMPLETSPIVRIVHPLRLKPDTPCTWREGRIVLRHRLQEYVNGLSLESKSAQLANILGDFNGLFEKWPMEMIFNMGSGWLGSNSPSKKTEEFLEDIHKSFKSATRFLQSLVSHPDEKSTAHTYPTIFRYRDLVASHVSVNYTAVKQAHENLAANRGRDWQETKHMSPPMSTWMHEVSHIYADRVPEIVEQMKSRYFSNETLVVESWWTMMFRAILWELSVVYLSPDTFPPIASQFYGSRTPVYIA
ncbi:MAG: hypothetical protein M1821_008005 [Bathelium mastoideum]|nr:MAG: hypothetical protein M1821_008005 [Bathelium mastoideum]